MCVSRHMKVQLHYYFCLHETRPSSSTRSLILTSVHARAVPTNIVHTCDHANALHLRPRPCPRCPRPCPCRPRPCLCLHETRPSLSTRSLILTSVHARAAQRAKIAQKVHKPPLGVNVINVELNGFNAFIWVPWSPSDTKKL